MTELCFIRHGETDWNLKGLTQGSTDIPLNSLGEEQARLTGDGLRDEKWDLLYASDLGRARRTAELIGAALGITEISLDPRLRERGFGEAEGLSATLRKERYSDSSSIPGAEPWEAVRERGLAAAESIVAAHPGKRILVVSHGGLIMSLLSHLSDGEVRRGKPLLRNLSQSLVSYDGRWRVGWVNRVVPELEDEPVSA